MEDNKKNKEGFSPKTFENTYNQILAKFPDLLPQDPKELYKKNNSPVKNTFDSKKYVEDTNFILNKSTTFQRIQQLRVKIPEPKFSPIAELPNDDMGAGQNGTPTDYLESPKSPSFE